MTSTLVRTNRLFLVITFGYGGHVPLFHRKVIAALLENGARVRSICGWNDEVREAFSDCDAEVRDRLMAWDVPDLPRQNSSGLAGQRLDWIPAASLIWGRVRNLQVLHRIRALRHWWEIRRLTEEYRARDDLVTLVFTFGDELLIPGLSPSLLNTLIDLPWTAICIESSLVNRLCAELRDGKTSPLRARHCLSIGVLEGVLRGERTALPDRPRICTLPDESVYELPKLLPPAVSEIQLQACGRTVVGLVGQITPRKNLWLLQRMVEKADRDRFFFVVAGAYNSFQFSKAERQWMVLVARGVHSNMYVRLERIRNEGEFNAVLTACDVLFAAYRDFSGSSNILSKAAHFGKAIIVSRGHLMEKLSQSCQRVHVIGQDDVGEAMTALREVHEERQKILADVPARARQQAPIVGPEFVRAVASLVKIDV